MASNKKNAVIDLSMLSDEQKAALAAEYFKHPGNQPAAKPVPEPDMDPAQERTEAQLRAEVRQAIRNGEVNVQFHKMGVNKSGNPFVCVRVSIAGIGDAYASINL